MFIILGAAFIYLEKLDTTSQLKQCLLDSRRTLLFYTPILYYFFETYTTKLDNLHNIEQKIKRSDISDQNKKQNHVKVFKNYTFIRNHKR